MRVSVRVSNRWPCHDYCVYSSRRESRLLSALLTVVALAGLGLGAATPQAAAWSGAAAGQLTVTKEKPHKQHARSRPLDWTLSIPDIGVRANVIRLGGPPTGAISVPTFAEVWDVGWYRYGAVPGDHGNALLLGHVDTYMGPAVFYDLYELRPGDIVYVTLGHDDTKRFEVHWVKEVLKSHFPASRVLGGAEGRHLWLVTCGGQFDYVTRSYLSNIVVYTTLLQSHHHPRRHHQTARQPARPPIRKATPVAAAKVRHRAHFGRENRSGMQHQL
jgi:sortase (surface protein transpeptidase)